MTMSDQPDRLFVGGEWTLGLEGRHFPVYNPATGEEIAQVADGGAKDAVAALDAAAAVAQEWAATPTRRRSEILYSAFRLLMQRREDFARLITTEMGKPYAESLGEVNYAGEFLRWFAEEAPRIAGRYGANPEGTGEILVSHRPVGPCYLVTPWNFPLAMATRKIAPALAAGCTAVLKPADLTPLTVLRLTELLVEAGLPAGVINVITTTDPASVSDALLDDPRLRKISFTGSTPVGRQLMAKASRNVLRMSMELGGNAPFLVFEDADLDRALEGAMAAKFRNIGQACTAANRFIVHASVTGRFTDLISERVAALKVGNGLDDEVNVGPLITERAVDNAAALVGDSVDRGATVKTGGERLGGPGTFYAPTVIADVQPGSDILRKEIFGPVLAISSFETDEQAIRLANDTEYGLVSYAYTRDLGRGHRLIDELETGMMGLNTGVVSNAAAPFGGIKHSGTGKEGGREGIHEYLSAKYTLLAH